MENEISLLIAKLEEKKQKELKKLEEKYKDTGVLTEKLQNYFSSFLGKEYDDISFKELEKILKNELEELVNELDEVKEEIDTKNEVVKEFNELAKEMNYLHEETVEKKNELYELKQVIRKLKEENF